MYDDIIDLLINNFETDKTLKEIAQDYQHLEWLIVKERSSGSADPRRLAALNILLHFELKLTLEKLVKD
jgi:hypothetical protein